MFKTRFLNDMCAQITLQGQLLTIRDKNIQTCLQIFVKLMQYFTKFANFFINIFKFDIKLKLGLSLVFSIILNPKIIFQIITNRSFEFGKTSKEIQTNPFRAPEKII